MSNRPLLDSIFPTLWGQGGECFPSTTILPYGTPPSALLLLALLCTEAGLTAFTRGWITDAATVADISDYNLWKEQSKEAPQQSQKYPQPTESDAAPVRRQPGRRKGKHWAFRPARPSITGSQRCRNHCGWMTRDRSGKKWQDWWRLRAVTQSQSLRWSNSSNTFFSPTLEFTWTGMWQKAVEDTPHQTHTWILILI